MLLDNLWSQTGVALLGGAAAEMLHWYALARKPGALAKYRTKPVYWITTLGMILLGGAMPLLYVQGTASALLCFHLGAATPVIVQKLVAAVPTAGDPSHPADSLAGISRDDTDSGSSESHFEVGRI